MPYIVLNATTFFKVENVSSSQVTVQKTSIINSCSSFHLKCSITCSGGLKIKTKQIGLTFGKQNGQDAIFSKELLDLCLNLSLSKSFLYGALKKIKTLQDFVQFGMLSCQIANYRPVWSITILIFSNKLIP